MGDAGWISVAILGLGVFLVLGLIIFTRRSGGKQRSKARVKGFGLSVDAESSSDVTPGVRVEDALSSDGGLKADDNTGRGVSVLRVQTKNDISLSSGPPTGGDAPKP